MVRHDQDGLHVRETVLVPELGTRITDHRGKQRASRILTYLLCIQVYAMFELWVKVVPNRIMHSLAYIQISGLPSLLGWFWTRISCFKMGAQIKCSSWFEPFGEQQQRKKVQQKENELKDTLKPPTPVQQPLKIWRKTLQWLFFLHMPKSFRILSTLSLTAQQMLVPHPWNACCGGIGDFSKSKYLSI